MNYSLKRSDTQLMFNDQISSRYLKVKLKLYIFVLNLQKSLETYADRKTNKKYLLTHYLNNS